MERSCAPKIEPREDLCESNRFGRSSQNLKETRLSRPCSKKCEGIFKSKSIGLCRPAVAPARVASASTGVEQSQCNRLFATRRRQRLEAARGLGDLISSKCSVFETRGRGGPITRGPKKPRQKVRDLTTPSDVRIEQSFWDTKYHPKVSLVSPQCLSFDVRI